MADQQDTGVDITLKASTAMTSKQFYFVVMSSSDGQVALVDATTDVPLGILQTAPDSGQAAVVRILGHSKCIGGESITAGNIIGTGKDGKATVITPGTETTTYPAGLCAKSTTTDSQVCEVILLGGHNRAA